ncbi:alpha/beta hydrolase [Paenibacillus hexagrammi]|uniref:Alpha/beta hydrolase n=1 Tax=Paenibacillus hexagrammi TaxID=2908839 RepID=A0ABY3SN74_9BACL|nr:alpha/beta hydrolase [Paenibacillus sp. YPD9-1]UJF34437.1 alpha/beta hydrolase [Paenibacillus sp. YPD9-1]
MSNNRQTIELWPGAAISALNADNEGCPALTYYPAEGEGIRSAIIVCPGGGYVRRAPHEGEPVALWLNSLGISAFVLHYRVAPNRHPLPLQDAQRAIRTVRHYAKEWSIDPNRLGILGFSAGGHLTSTAATHFDDGNPQADDPVETYSSRPDLQVLCYPVITFGEHTHAGSKLSLLGESPDEEWVRQLSNETRVTPDSPPAFLWHTADDAAVPVENSLQYAAALSRQQVPFELHVFPSGVHGLGLAESHPEAKAWTDLCAVWLTKQGFR